MQLVGIRGQRTAEGRVGGNGLKVGTRTFQSVLRQELTLAQPVHATAKGIPIAGGREECLEAFHFQGQAVLLLSVEPCVERGLLLGELLGDAFLTA